MAVYPNGRSAVRNPGRYFGVSPGLDLYSKGLGDRLNRFTGESWDEVTGAVPSGYGISGVVPPVKSGGISGKPATSVTVETSGSGVMGFPISGTTSITFSVQDADGQMIVSGSGTSTFGISCNSPLLLAIIGTTGSSSFSLSFNNATLGALASGDGSASFTVTGYPSSILPTSTPNPRMTGTTGFTVSGVLTPYALGHMTGTTEDLTGMTPSTVAQAVWGTMSNQYDEAGTMGSKLIAAGNAGDPWSADLSGYTEGTPGFALDIIQKLLRNKQITDPITGQMIVYDDDGTTPLFTAQIFQDAADSTPYSGKGVERKDRLE